MKRFLGALALALVAAGCGKQAAVHADAAAPAEAAPTDAGGTGVISVDVTQSRGTMPTFFEPSAFVEFAPGSMMQQFATDSVTTHGMLVMTTQHELGDSTSLADYESRLAASSLGTVATQANKAGMQFLLQIQAMPRWLSSQPNATALVCPNDSWRKYQTVAPDPAKWPQWEQMVAATVHYFKVTLGLSNVWYQLWEEPDGGDSPCFWTDTQAAYLAMWQHTMAGARSADPTARVGGPGTAGGATAVIGKATTPVAEALIKQSVANGTPLSFVSFHLFGVVPEWGYEQAKTTAAWLKQAGVPKTPIVISSHNPKSANFSDPSWPAPPSALGEWQTDNEMGAAWVLSLFSSLDRAGVTGYQAMYQLDDADQGTVFPHGWGARTAAAEHGIKKAIYWALTLPGRMERQRVAVTVPADPALHFPQLYALATASSSRLTVLVWRYVSMPSGMVKAMLYDLGYGKADVARFGGDAAVQTFFTGTEPASKLTSVPKEQADLEATRVAYRRQRELVTEPQTFSLAVKGFASATGYQLQRALIDAHHSNAYAHFVSGGLSDALAHQSLEFVDTRHLASLSDLGSFTLLPYAITYIELKKE